MSKEEQELEKEESQKQKEELQEEKQEGKKEGDSPESTTQDAPEEPPGNDDPPKP